MIRFKSQLAAGAALAALSLAGFCLSPANDAVADAAQLAHPATGVGSCTLKNPDPKVAARNPTKLPLAKHPRPDHRERLPELRVRARPAVVLLRGALQRPSGQFPGHPNE